MDVVFISIEQFIGAFIVRVGALFYRKGCDAYDLANGDAADPVIAGNIQTKLNTEMEVPKLISFETYQKKGYGTEGLRLTVKMAKTIIPENEIYLRVNKENIASQKVMLNNGAYIAGEDSGHLFMRIPKEK